jgi:hypothetical protein
VELVVVVMMTMFAVPSPSFYILERSSILKLFSVNYFSIRVYDGHHPLIHRQAEAKQEHC